MILNRYTKQPADRLDYDLEYADWLSAGDALLSAVAVVEPVGGVTLDDPLIDGTRVKIFASAGANGMNYKITVTTTTVLFRIKQDEFYVRVRDY